MSSFVAALEAIWRVVAGYWPAVLGTVALVLAADLALDRRGRSE